VHILAASPVDPGTLLQRGHSLLGLMAFVLIALAIGRVRGARGVPWRVLIWGVILQFAFASVVLFGPGILEGVQRVIERLLSYTVEGSRMVFGNLAGLDAPVFTGPVGSGEALGFANVGSIFAFVVLPTIVFVSTLTAMLYHLGVLGWIVHGMAWLMQKTMGTSGAETLSTAANIFVGQTEAPLFVRPFLALATKSELMAVMVGGFANIATGVLVVYTEFLRDFVHNVGGHLAAACFVSAPATLVVAKLLMPETETPQTADTRFKVEKVDANVLDAATRGTTEGMFLAFNVGAMLIAFTALIALINGLLGWTGGLVGLGSISLQSIFGTIMAPLAWLTGMPWADARVVGEWLALKTVINEFVAYIAMSGDLRENPELISPRSALLATYALCGFANFASVGIQIGGISSLAPGRRADLSRIAMLAMIGGTIATLMGACVIGVLV
jgi:CNT family concentrative nucleoside transporter